VSGNSLTASVYLNGILGVNTEYNVYNTLINVCPDINAGTVNSTGCNGWCDEKISDVIEVNRAWHTDGNASEQIYAMLIEIETFSNQAWHNFGEALQELKVQEQEAQAAYGNNYTQDIENPDIKFGDGRRAVFQLTLDYGLQTYYGYEANSVRTSFSSPQWYHATSKNLFMTEGTDRNDLVYWLSGFNGQGASFGGTTEYNNPTGLAIDKAQRVHIADSNNYRILRMQNLWTNEFTVPIVGTGYQASNGDGQFATQTALQYPRGLTVDPHGVLLFSDPMGHTIRQVLGENWNLPCGYSNYYWNMLTAPTTENFNTIYSQIACRQSQVKATLLFQIELCQQCLNGTLLCNTTDLRDMKKELCATTAWQTRPLASALTLLMEEQPDCTGCGNVWGCQYPQANYTWNASEETTGENLTYQMTYWLSDFALQSGIDALDNLSTYAAGPIDWSSSNLANQLNEALATDPSVDALVTKVESIKTTLLSRTTSIPMKMAYFKMWQWYQNIVDLCISVVDSKDIDGKAIIGAQYYNIYSEIATRVFAPSLTTTTGTWSASSAYPKCDFQNPRMFGYESWMSFAFNNRAPVSTSVYSVGPAAMLHKQSIQGRCCNVNSYICQQAGEGPCQINIDCGAGLVCGKKNCLWSKEENCCMAIDAVHADAKIRVFANTVGYRNLLGPQGR
jgi:hypothetical protein